MVNRSGGFLFREARAQDKDEVLDFTGGTWEGHEDYIGWVYDEWLEEEDSCFLVAVDEASGKIAGIDKLQMLSPTEAWFEGIRVNPDFRGRGLSGLFQRRMLDEAAVRNARTVRFLTAPDNAPIHRIAYRDGFSMRFTVRHWRWAAGEVSNPDAAQVAETRLRTATSEEGPIVHDWWRRSGCCYATEGLVDSGWVFAETSRDAWEQMAVDGRVFVPDTADVRESATPPPVFIVDPRRREGEPLSWHITLACATGPEWEQLASAALQLARDVGVSEIDGLLPDLGALNEAFAAAGFTVGAWESFVLFEKRL
jgi:GNAT superfamily N-acetyltransferase